MERSWLFFCLSIILRALFPKLDKFSFVQGCTLRVLTLARA